MALAQYDPLTGQENAFKMIDFPKLKRFGWYPFTMKIARRVLMATGRTMLPTTNSSYFIDIHDGQKLVAFREHTVKMFSYWHCGKHSDQPSHEECGMNWMLQAVAPHPLIGLPYSNEVFIEKIPVQDQRGRHVVEVVNPICPKCGWHDINGPDRLRVIRKIADERREIVYVLGVQGGTVLRIKEDGSIEPDSRTVEQA